MTTPVIDAHESGPVDGPLVALVHGALDRGAGMLRIGRHLDDRYRVLRFDRRGYGRSRPHPGPFTLEANAEDLVSLLAGRRAVVVGHSLGSHVAMRAATMVPDQVVGVVCYEPPLSWEPWWPGSTGGSSTFLQSDPGDAAEAFMRRMAGDATWEALPERTRASRRAEGEAFLAEIVDLRRGRPWDPAAVRCPVVVGHGSLAKEHHVTGARLMASWLADATSIELEGATHGAHTSAAGPFVERLVAPLLARVSPADRP